MHSKLVVTILVIFQLNILNAASINHNEKLEEIVTKGYHNIDGHTYFFSEEYSQNQNTAYNDCGRKLMQLISFDTKEKSDAIANFITTNNINEKHWTSGQRQIDYTFFWTTAMEPFTYTNWAPSEPNYNDPSYPFVCVGIDENGEWYDTRCTDYLRWICE